MGSPHTTGTVLSSALLPDATVADVTVLDGRIARVDRAAPATPAAYQETGLDVVDLSGFLLLPAPVEPHAHLDKVYTADQAVNASGDLAGAVAAWLRYRPAMSEADLTARATRAVADYVANGVTALRTHVDVGADVGLRALRTVLAVRDSCHDSCQIQVVAFAGVPLSGADGPAHRDLLSAALAAGADLVGACPALDPDPAACIEACLAVAADRSAGVDLHVDEGLDVQPCTLEMLADQVTASGFPGPVVASHCVSLGMMDTSRAGAIAEKVAAAGICVVCLPQTNLFLQGRANPVATPRGLTALRVLRAAGVTVCAGGDNVQDPFNCLGRADPLDTAALLVMAGHDTPEQAYAAVSTAARQALRLSEVDISPGASADLLAIRASSVREAIASATPDRITFHAGRVVARTSTTRRVAVGSHCDPAATVIRQLL